VSEQEHHLCRIASPEDSSLCYVCAECGGPVDRIHVPGNCGCGGAPFIFPCAHSAEVVEAEADG